MSDVISCASVGLILGVPALLVWLLVRLSRLSTDMATLNTTIRDLSGRLGSRAPRPAAARPRPTALSPEPPPLPTCAKPPPLPASARRAVADAVPPPLQIPPFRDRAEPSAAAAPEARASGARDLEASIGQKWLVRAGALVLLTGLGLLYVYAVERGWINEAQRAVSTAVVAGAVMAGGAHCKRRGYDALAQGLVAVGSGLLFFDAFTAHRFYSLLPGPVALVAMTAVMAITAAFALRWSAMPLLLLAQATGYAVPFLISRPAIAPDAALAYLLAVNAGVLAVAAVKRWWTVQIIAVITTPVLFLVAAAVATTPAWPGLTGWACAFHGMFLAAVALSALMRRATVGVAGQAALVVGCAGIAWFGQASLVPAHPMVLTGTLIAVAGVHAFLGEAFARQAPLDVNGREVLRGGAAALVLDAARFVVWGDDCRTTLAFIAMGALLALAARRRASVAFGSGAFVGLGIVVGRVLTMHLHAAGGASAARPFMNPDFAVAIASVAVITAVGWSDRRDRWLATSTAALLFALVATTEVAFLLASGQTDAEARGSMIAIAHAVGAAAVFTGFARSLRRGAPLAVVGVCMTLGVLALGLAVLLGQHLQRAPSILVLNTVCIASLATGLAVLGAAAVLRRNPDPSARSGALVFTAAGALMPLVTLSVEASRYFAWTAPSHGEAFNASSGAVSVTWAVYAAIVLTVGFARRLPAARLAALGLLAITLGKVVMFDLSMLDQLARILAFIGLGVVLIAGAWAYHRFAPLLTRAAAK